MNTRTLVATFNDDTAAREAEADLENLGISSDAIHIQSSQRSMTAGSAVHQGEQSGFAGWWNSLFGSDHDENERTGYEGALAAGSTILSAQVPENLLDRSADILNRYGAADIDRGRAQGSAADSTKLSASARTQKNSGGPIEVIEEELQVGKRAIQRGGVRIYSHVVATPVEENIKLSEEHVKVERRPVNRDLSAAEASNFRDQTIEVTEMAEEAVVSKRSRVVEEILVGKQATERTETVRDTLRHTEVEVEQLAEGTRNAATNDYSTDYRKNFDQFYAPSGVSYESVHPAYDYGYRSANDTRYHGKSWDQVETNLRSDYETRNPGSSWEKAKNAVRYGWDKVTGK